MPKPTQFDLALTRPRSAPKPVKPPARSIQAAGAVLAKRRHRLYRLIERTQATIAEIEAELRSRGAVINGPPRHYERTLPFKHNELPRLCLNILRVNQRPTHIREIVARVLRDKGLDPLDKALADVTVHRARDCMLHMRRKGVVVMVGALHSKSAKWTLVDG